MKKPHDMFCYCLTLFLTLVAAYTADAQQIRTIQISPNYSLSGQTAPQMTSQTGELMQQGTKPSSLITGPQQSTESEQAGSESDGLRPSEPALKEGRGLSAFEQFIAGNKRESVSTDIHQFGYDLFSKPSSKFKPSTEVPVGPGYVIGPGDEVRITVWGKVEGIWSVVVDRDGTVSLPKIGVLGVTGLTFNELKTVLQKEFSKYYTGFEMNVSMGALRSMRIYVVGNAQAPGAYTLSALSTLVNAIFEAGGPSKTGSMREIQLKRNGETIVSFDMYEFLLKGDNSKDVRLMPEDVIFIPPVGPLIGIAGNVQSPAIYEMKGESRLLEMIRMAGGLASTAFKGRFQIQRIYDHQYRTMIEGDFFDISDDTDKNIFLEDGDLVKVYSVVETDNTIELTGAVSNEGNYAIIPGVTRLGDVISKAGGVSYYSSNKAELTRVRITEDGPVTNLLQIDISKAVAGDMEHNIPLEINDYLFVRAIPGWKLYEKVSVSGEVRYPGTYTIRTDETLSSLIERAGGYTENAYLRGAFFTRNSVRELQQKSLTEMIQRLERELISVSSVQASTAASSEEITSEKAVSEQKRKFIESLKQLQSTGRVAIHLAHLRLLKNSKYDIELEEGDSLHIPMKNNVVNVVGAVMSRGSFIYTDKLDYDDYVGMTGGYTQYADKKRVYVLKADGTARKLSNGFFTWNTFNSRWEMAGFGEEIKEIEPSDTIVVPEKLEHIAWMREIKDITQILYQIATTAGVLIVAF